MSKQDGKRINSKAKGSEFELKTAKILGSWWGEELHRTPMSGGLHWKKDNRVAGDIVTPPDSIFPFSVECKKREGWLFDQLLKGTGEIEEWWLQCIRDADSVDMRPFLIFAKNFTSPYLMISACDFISILKYKNNRLSINYFFIDIKDKPSRIILVLSDFLESVSKEDIIGAFKL